MLLLNNMRKNTIIKLLLKVLGSYRLALIHASNFQTMSDDVTDQINDLLNSIEQTKIIK